MHKSSDDDESSVGTYAFIPMCYYLLTNNNRIM